MSHDCPEPVDKHNSVNNLPHPLTHKMNNSVNNLPHPLTPKMKSNIKYLNLP